LLRRAAGGVALDDEDLGQRRILLLAVRELSRKSRDIQCAFSASHFASLPCSLARPGRLDDLRHDRSCFLRVLEEKFSELVGYYRLDDALDLGRDELVLRLRGELGIG